MFSVDFDNVVQKRIESCLELLCNKSAEYAQTERSYRDEDRLHNFKVAAELQGCTPIKALAGMMSKHTVSVYDLIDKHEQGEYISPEMWSEKIGDHINYLLLLTALIKEENDSRVQCATANCNTERG